ncbi:hypothetical protein [Lysinibacillus boronitolerans]|uniref:hypothetical protein n=1 Tax=Lysinibacillus boronitolerans TaxID=309788 RepID=UPI00289AD788|nr:hypothetical protein [Lysinibacillus boronitolerans]
MVILKNSSFKKMLEDYLILKKEKDLANIIKSCEIELTYTGHKPYNTMNYTYADLKISVPILLMEPIEAKWFKMKSYCEQVFNDNDHRLNNVDLKMKVPILEEDETKVIKEHSIYNNLITKFHNSNIDSIEKDYILEGCNCAIHGNRLAAATMIGCAIERLLFRLCNAYLDFMKNTNVSEREISRFESDVVNAKKAHARLDGFIKKVNNSEQIFKQMGLENSNLHFFSVLDIIRQVRNESGHPTGKKISEEDLHTIYSQYQLLIDRIHQLIIELPTLVPEVK